MVTLSHTQQLLNAPTIPLGSRELWTTCRDLGWFRILLAKGFSVGNALLWAVTRGEEEKKRERKKWERKRKGKGKGKRKGEKEREISIINPETASVAIFTASR